MYTTMFRYVDQISYLHNKITIFENIKQNIEEN